MERAEEIRQRNLSGPHAFIGNQRVLASAVTAATTTTAASAATTAAAVATTAAATTTVFPWPGFVDRQRPTVVLLLVKRIDGRLGCVVVSHFNEAKSLAAPCVTVLNHLCATNLAKLGEEALQRFIGHAITEIADVQFLTHCQTP